ncbi:hypothetical protein [Nocardia callitridis]|uniref:Glycine zipper family protein n=1 Tax=Nocardia callitridis TaxID=648753 RepID=A0ABP9JR21_9NOCA
MFKTVTLLTALALCAAPAAIANAESPVAPPPHAAIPIASPQENTAAMQSFTSIVGVGTVTGAVVGGVIGAVAGCAIGAGTLAITVIGIPPGCLAGGAAGVGIGGALGTVVVGGPAAAVAGVDLIQTLIAPAGSTQYAQR